MDNQVVTVTVQAALFSAVSTTLAQTITMYQQQKFSMDLMSLVRFMIIAMITTPPNYLYQRWLEVTFPARPVASKSKSKGVEETSLSVPNTMIKFLMDQSIGAAANTIAFIVLMGLLNGKTLAQSRADVERNFYSMLSAGWSVWPAVTLLNLVVVPFEYRMIVGNAAGVLWGVYMNLKTL